MSDDGWTPQEHDYLPSSFPAAKKNVTEYIYHVPAGGSGFFFHTNDGNYHGNGALDYDDGSPGLVHCGNSSYYVPLRSQFSSAVAAAQDGITAYNSWPPPPGGYATPITIIGPAVESSSFGPFIVYSIPTRQDGPPDSVTGYRPGQGYPMYGNASVIYWDGTVNGPP